MSIAGDGLVEPAQILQCIAKIIVRTGKAGINLKGVPEACNSLLELARILKRKSQIAVAFGIVGVDRERLTKVIRGVFIFSLAGKCGRQHIEENLRFGTCFHELPRPHFGLTQLSRRIEGNEPLDIVRVGFDN